MLAKHSADLDAVDALPDPQRVYLLLRYCFATRIHYWLRTVAPNVVPTLAPAFDARFLQSLATLLDRPTDALPPWLRLLG